MARAKRGEPMRFALDVIENARGDGPCILWPYGTSDHGYPKLCDTSGARPRWWRVTRYVMMAIDGGPDKAKLEVAHQAGVCHNRLCIRPAHLRWATRSENARDKIIDGTTGRHLTAVMAQEIRDRYALGGITQRQLAIDHGVTTAAVNHVTSGRSWSPKEMAS